MSITIKLDDGVDISFFKKMLSQIKGVKEVEVNEEQELIKKAIEKSRKQFGKGQFKETSPELLDEIFRKK